MPLGFAHGYLIEILLSTTSLLTSFLSIFIEAPPGMLVSKLQPLWTRCIKLGRTVFLVGLEPHRCFIKWYWLLNKALCLDFETLCFVAVGIFYFSCILAVRLDYRIVLNVLCWTRYMGRLNKEEHSGDLNRHFAYCKINYDKCKHVLTNDALFRLLKSTSCILR